MTVKTFKNGAWRLVLDSDEVVPNDPGAGAPAMVYGPDAAWVTFWCALGEGVACNKRHEDVLIPRGVLAWLEAKWPMVEEFIHEHHELKKGSA